MMEALLDVGAVLADAGADAVARIVFQTNGAEITDVSIPDVIVRIVGFALLGAGTAAAAAITFRWYSGDEIPDGIAILLGVSIVAIWLNTKTALGDAIIGDAAFTDPATAIYTVAAFLVSAIAADGGRRVGDHLAHEVFQLATPRSMDEVSQFVRSAGRVITVELPEEIADIDGYEPVDDRITAELAGMTLLFPRRLTVGQLEERLVTRLQRDYAVGRVDVDLREDATVEYLAVGSTQTGIGPSLAPRSVAVAIRADPPADASPGDAVRIWKPRDGTPRRVTTAELRAATGDVATVAVGANSGESLDAEGPYRLVTLPGGADAGREFVSLLRAAAETVTTTTVEPGDALDGEAAGGLAIAVLVVERDGEILALPDGDTTLRAGDVAYLLGRPEAFRRLEER